MEMLFRLKQIILKVSAIVDTSFAFGMASHVFEQQYRLPIDECQQFNQQSQPPGFSSGCRLPLVAPQRQGNGFTFGCELESSRGVSIQRVISCIDRSISMRRRRKNDSCDSLRRVICWVVINAVLTCALVIGLLFLLKYVNSPLLRSEGQNDLTEESLFIESSAQKECRPCPATEQNDESSSKLTNCCTVGLNQEALQKLIEKMTRETISKQLPATPNQRNISGGQETSKAAVRQDPCAALFFLYKDPAMTTQSDNYTALRGWGSDGNVAYKWPCLSYDDSTGEVIVSQGGLYLVYSHLAFNWEKPTDPTRPTVLGQEIRAKITKGVQTTETIAKDTRAIQPNHPGVGPGTPSYNSRTLTIVRLREGDRLTVNAKPSRLVIRDNAISSFGLYKV